MGNLIDLPNINPESIVIDGEKTSKSVKNSSFDEKNYLNIRLNKDESEKTITIRLLPMDLQTGNPFVKIHVHNVEVNKKMVAQGAKPYKSYICLRKTEDIDHEKYGRKCPYCELNYQAYLESTKETDPIKKQELQNASIANREREAVIVRCIERGKEDEGVKFWKFNLRADKTDPYHQIIKLYNLRKEAAEKKGKTENILDIYEGRDLSITITADGTSAPTIVDDSDRSPLSENAEQMKAWIYDKKKWQDVFTCKPYEYLKLVSEFRIPWFDKEHNIWVDKEEFDGVHNDEVKEANDKIATAEKQLVIEDMPEAQPEPVAEKKDDFINSISIEEDEDGLPF